MTVSMNTTKMSGEALKRALADKLRELLGKVDWLEDWSLQNFPTITGRGFAFLVKLPLPKGGHAELWVQCKSDPRPSQFPYAFVSHEGKRQPVLVFGAPVITPRMAEVCHQEGWSWFDLAGNHRLDVPGLLQLQHTGNPPVHESPRPVANLSTPEAGRVIRALLLPEHAKMRWTQRAMQNQCQPNVSLGLVNKVVRHLRDEAFVEESNDGFRLRDPLKLLFAWRDVYRFDRHERRGYFTLLQGKKLSDALGGLSLQTGGFAAYAVFSAADFQAPHVRQPKTWMYIREQDVSKLEKWIEAKPVESGENLIILIPEDEGVFYLGDGGTMGNNRMSCTNLVQTYVDLWHCGGRGKEAADAVLEQRLKPAWGL